MKARRAFLWHAPAAVGAAAVALLGTGAVLALTQSFGERLGPAPRTGPVATSNQAGAFRVVALGDSLTHGSGDEGSRGGYAGRVVEALRQRGREVVFKNLAVPGAETGDLLERLAGDHLAQQLAQADLIIVSIGGNDLAHALRLTSAAGGDDEPEQALTRVRDDLRTIVSRLRSQGSTARIRLLGLYNPFEVLPEAKAEARAQLLAWNHAIEAAAAAFDDVLAVPISDLFADRPDRLAGDHFHPGSFGHALIAERVLSTLAEADERR